MSSMDAVTSEYDHLFKIILIGDSGVGKSSLLNRYVDDQFSVSFIPTIGVDFKIKTMDVGSQRIKLQLWDTAGQERFQAITRAYYKGADGILVVYDITSAQSFQHVQRWLEDVTRYSPKSAVSVVVGNKSDQASARAVDLASAQALGERLGVRTLETSAKDSTGVDAAFRAMVNEILSHRQVEPGSSAPSDTPIDLHGSRVDRPRKKCC